MSDEKRTAVVCAAHGILGHRCTIAVPREEIASLRASLAEAEAENARLETLLVKTADALELSLSLDPDTTDYAGDIAQCESALEEARGTR